MKSDSSSPAAPQFAVSLAPAPMVGGHLAYPAFSVSSVAAFAQSLERAGAAFVLVGDGALDTQGVRTGAGPLGLESFTLASFLAVRTRRLGIVPVLNANYREPFAFARLIASLDHVSAGRSGWYVTQDESGNAAANHQAQPSTPAQRQARAAEFIDVIEGLFDTWEDGAFIRDKSSGQFIDTDRVHFLKHDGAHFKVKGPLNVAPTPQGRPVRFSGQAIGAPFDAHAHGDVVLWSGRHTSQQSLDEARGKGAARRFFKRVAPYVADTLEAALNLAEGSANGRPEDRFIGTWDGWAAEAARLTQAGGYDGLLLELPDVHALDAEYAQRLLALAGATVNDADSESGTLLARLNLPRPLNRFAALQPG